MAEINHLIGIIPGKSSKGVLVECGPGGYSPGHTHAESAFEYTCPERGFRYRLGNA